MIERPLLQVGAALLGAAAAIAPAGAIELLERDAVRVCADGNLLPFSNEAGEGFENEIAELIGRELGVPVVYYWSPQTIGFVRNTLGTRQCDLIIGTASGEALMQNTNPYYRTTYALVYRTDSGLTATHLGDPALLPLRAGVILRTPPADLLARYGYREIEPYQLATDTRVHSPPREAIEDVAAGKTDFAVIWGPFAGYYASRQSVPLTVVPLLEEPPVFRLAFDISMGLRADEPEWKHWLNDFISEHQAEINGILLDYGVPLLAADGTLIEATE